MQPDQLPPDKTKVNGFEHTRSNEYYVEWRYTDRDIVAKVWIEFGARGPDVWDVLATVRRNSRGSSRGELLEQPEIAEVPGGPGSFEKALEEAVRWMRRFDTGERGSGELDLPDANNFNFGL